MVAKPIRVVAAATVLVLYRSEEAFAGELRERLAGDALDKNAEKKVVAAAILKLGARLKGQPLLPGKQLQSVGLGAPHRSFCVKPIPEIAKERMLLQSALSGRG